MAKNTALISGYRHDIDGLRAVAVLAVLINHAWPSALPGGFLGVDVFFAISGFLVGGIVWDALVVGNFSLPGFFVRRVLRLAPAFVVVAVASLAAGYVFLAPEQYAQMAATLAAASVSLANVQLAGVSGYFDPDLSGNAAMHLWSLAIEEQFYLFLPVLFLLLYRNRVLLACVGMALIILSFGWSVARVTDGDTRAYFSLLTRAWELGLGVALALAMRWAGSSGSWRVHPAAGALSLVGVGVLGYCFMVVSPEALHPGWITLVPVLATLMILFSARHGLAFVILAQPALVAIGLTSYSIYLWHQPVLVILKSVVGGFYSPGWAILGLVLSLAFGALSWRFVEETCRHLKWRSGRVILVYGLSVLCVLWVSLSVWVSRGIPERVPTQVISRIHLEVSSPEKAASRECHTTLNTLHLIEDPCVHGPDETPGVILFGNSHAASLASGFLRADPSFSFVQMSYSGCIVLEGVSLVSALPCERIASQAVKRISQIDGARVVVLHSRLSALRAQDIDAPLRRQVAELRAEGLQVVLVDPVPEHVVSVPEAIAARALLGDLSSLRLSHSAYEDMYAAHLRLIEDIAMSDAGVHRIRSADLLCADASCAAEGPEGIYYYDEDHMTAAGAAQIARRVIALINDL